MMGYYSRKSLRMGKAGKLVQVAGHAFELEYEVEMFTAQTLAHTTGSNQLAEDFRARSSDSYFAPDKRSSMRIQTNKYSF